MLYENAELFELFLGAFLVLFKKYKCIFQPKKGGIC